MRLALKFVICLIFGLGTVGTTDRLREARFKVRRVSYWSASILYRAVGPFLRFLP